MAHKSCQTNETQKMREPDIKSVLLVADQPYQARVMGFLAEKLIRRKHKVTIVIADYYTFLHASHVIDELTLTGARVEHQQRNFFAWQGTEPEDPQDTESFLTAWEARNCSERSLSQLERTNNFIFSDEREYFALKVNHFWRRRILKDTIVWLEEIFSSQRPDVVMSIDNCTLVNNLIFTLSQSRSIPHLTCKNTRIMNRWNIRRDFCLGVGSATSSEVASISKSGRWIDEVEAFRNWFNSHGRGAYVAPAQNTEKNAKYDATKTFFRGILDLLARLMPRIGESHKLRRAGIRRLEQSFFRLSVYELRALVRRLASAFGFHPFTTSHADLPREKFFFWALHFRPEGSVLVQGLGVDEITYLETCSRSLPEGAFLYVKEHPFMFGFRARDFYDRLKSMKGVRLIAPWENSMQLIQSSAGVVGVAGTVLLEAEIAGKPGWALGKPEFVDYLTGSGTEKLAEFLRDAVDTSKYVHNPKKINDYLAYVLASSEEDDFWLNDGKIPIEQQDLTQTIARMSRAIEGVISAKTP